MLGEDGGSGPLGALLAALDDAVIAYDEAGRVVAWNAAIEHLLGISVRDALGCAIDEVVPASLAACRTGTHAPVFRTVQTNDVHGLPLSVSVKHVRLDGRASTCGGILIVRPLDAVWGGSVIEPSAETVWNASHERLSLVLDASGLGDWSWDAETDVVSFSPRVAELFGIAAGCDLTRTALRGLIHPDDRHTTMLAVDAAIAERSDYHVEFRVLRAGSEHWISSVGRGQYDASGRVRGLFGVMQDVTNQRFLGRVEEAIRSLAEPADITETAATMLGRQLRVSRCLCPFIRADEAISQLTADYTDGVASLVARHRISSFGVACLEMMQSGELFVSPDTENDPRILGPNRDVFRAIDCRAILCAPLRKSGRVVAAMILQMQSPRSWQASEIELVRQVVSRCWESIERARVEREREELLKVAERANRAKDEFLAMLGHELRNPLAPITTALALMQVQGNAFARERTIIERQVKHLTRLVDDLLDVSRIAKGKVELNFERVELAEIVSRAIEVADSLLEQRAHTLKVQVPPVGLLVQGDMARLVQVVSNLLTNAAKYTPPGGQIEVFGSADGDELQLRVLDNGVGMSADILEHVFDLFVQGRQTIDRAHGGLGLGLAIVKSLVERHGGTVSAYSAGPTLGSELVVRLPRAQPLNGVIECAHGERAAVKAIAGDRARVLVVDDNEDAAEMLAAMLGTYNCEVSVAHDPVQALRSVAEASYELALLDIGLPVIDGYELAVRLRELPHMAGARLIAVTGYGQEADRQRALSAGFEAHLVKPVDRAALESIVASLHRAS